MRRSTLPLGLARHSTLAQHPVALDLCSRLLRLVPSERLTCQQALDHMWFNDSVVAQAPSPSFYQVPSLMTRLTSSAEGKRRSALDRSWKQAQSLKGQAQPALQRYVATASGNYVTKSQAAARKAREQMQTKQQPQQQQQSAQQQLQQRDAKTNESNRTSANKGGVPGVTVSQKAYQQEHAYAEAQRLHAQLRAQSEKIGRAHV